MGLIPTLTILAACVAITLIARHMSARPVRLGQARLIPWTTVLILAVFVAILMIVHLVNLAGYETGGGRGRRGFSATPAIDMPVLD